MINKNPIFINYIICLTIKMSELYFYVHENIDKLDWDELSKNEGAIELLLEFPERINWDLVIMNKNKKKLYKKCPEKINWKNEKYDELKDFIDFIDLYKINWIELSFIPEAIHILEKNIDKVNLLALSKNPKGFSILKKLKPELIKWNLIEITDEVISFIKENSDKVNFKQLSLSLDKRLFETDLFEIFIDKINWINILHNPNSISFLEKHLDKIDWDILSYNENASSILEKNIDKINWNDLSRNEGTLNLLSKYPDKINFILLLDKNKNYIEFFKMNIHNQEILNIIDWDFILQYPYLLFLFKTHFDKFNYELFLDFYFKKFKPLASSNDILFDFIVFLFDMKPFEFDDLFSNNVRATYHFKIPDLMFILKTKNCALLEHFYSKINKPTYWSFLEKNENITSFLENHNDKLTLNSIKYNKNIIKYFLEKNYSQTQMIIISSCKNALPILEKNMTKINFIELSKNINEDLWSCNGNILK